MTYWDRYREKVWEIIQRIRSLKGGEAVSEEIKFGRIYLHKVNGRKRVFTSIEGFRGWADAVIKSLTR